MIWLSLVDKKVKRYLYIFYYWGVSKMWDLYNDGGDRQVSHVHHLYIFLTPEINWLVNCTSTFAFHVIFIFFIQYHSIKVFLSKPSSTKFLRYSKHYFHMWLHTHHTENIRVAGILNNNKISWIQKHLQSLGYTILISHSHHQITPCPAWWSMPLLYQPLQLVNQRWIPGLK